MEFIRLDFHLKTVMSFICSFYFIFRLMNREIEIILNVECQPKNGMSYLGYTSCC